MTDSEIRNKGFDFSFNPHACDRCPGNCCGGETGNIWVNEVEIKKISGFLKISVFDFIHDYLHKKNNLYTLREIAANGNYFCVFLDREKHRCDVYPVRPEQCRKYPFWNYFKKHPEQLIKECPGVEFPGVTLPAESK